MGGAGGSIKKTYFKPEAGALKTKVFCWCGEKGGGRERECQPHRQKLLDTTSYFLAAVHSLMKWDDRLGGGDGSISDTLHSESRESHYHLLSTY